MLIFLKIGQCKGSKPTNLPILSKIIGNYDMEAMDYTLPMKIKATTMVPTGTSVSIEMTITPILVITKIKLGFKPDLVILFNQIPKMLGMLTQNM